MPLARLRQGQHTGGGFHPSKELLIPGAPVSPGRARQLVNRTNYEVIDIRGNNKNKKHIQPFKKP